MIFKVIVPGVKSEPPGCIPNALFTVPPFEMSIAYKPPVVSPPGEIPLVISPLDDEFDPYVCSGLLNPLVSQASPSKSPDAGATAKPVPS